MNESPTLSADEEAQEQRRRRFEAMVSQLTLTAVAGTDPLYDRGMRYECTTEGTRFVCSTRSGLRRFISRVMLNRVRGSWATEGDWHEQCRRGFSGPEMANLIE